MESIVLEALQISWAILAVGLVFGVGYSIVRIIPKREE